MQAYTFIHTSIPVLACIQASHPTIQASNHSTIHSSKHSMMLSISPFLLRAYIQFAKINLMGDDMIVYIMPQGERWAVKREHEDRPVSVHDTKKNALETAKEIAMGVDAELVILRADGTIDNLGAYSIDPFPSEDLAPDYNDELDEESNDMGSDRI